jgi:hypothetical protein
VTDTAQASHRFPADMVAAFDDAQRRTIALFRQVRDGLEPGMTERDIVDAMEARAPDHGFDRWFHRPHVRFGCPARVPHLPNSKTVSKKGTLIEIDAAPADDSAFGDFGTALVMGGGPEPEIIQHARELVRACAGYASRFKCTGELFVYADAWTRNRGLNLGDSNSIGHVCFPKIGRTAPMWPYLARAAIIARRHQIQWFNYRRLHGLFALQPRVVDGKLGCCFEEMIIVDGDIKRVLGRDNFEECGTL